MKWEEVKSRASELRNNATSSEVLLWNELRNRKLMGRKFLRQHPVVYDMNRDNNEMFFFVPDFYCASERLIIELDGKIHQFLKEKDEHRDAILKSLNLKILRFNNEDLNDIQSVLKRIIHEFNPELEPVRVQKRKNGE